MRILHFAQNVAGGISSYFDEIAQHQLDHYGPRNVIFLMPDRDVANLSRVPHECVRTFDCVERTPGDFWKLAKLVRRVTAEFEPEIIHLHSTFAGTIFRAVIPFLRRRPKVVYCPHGWAFAREQSAKASYVYARLESLMMRWTDVCINISENEARLAVAHGVPLDKCVTVQNGIAVDVGRRGPLIRPDPDERAGIRLLFVGRHDPQKGVDILLRAMQLVQRPGLHLDVAGASVVSKSTVDHLVTRPNVTLLGHVTRGQVQGLMESCDAIVVPSRWEGFGLVVLEAMRVGKPAIVSPNGALPDLVEDGVTGFIARDMAPAGLATLLDSLDQATLARMGEAAERRFRALYTSDRMNAGIDDIYRRLVPAAFPLAPVPQSAPNMSRV